MRRPTRVFVSVRSRDSALLVLLAYLVLTVAIAIGVPRLFPSLVDPVTVRTAVLRAGPFAPAVFIGLQAGQVLLAPIPGQVLGFIAGYLFGAFWGTVYSVAGATIGGYVAFRLARRYGRPAVERLVHDEALTLFDAFSTEHGRTALFVIFLIPGLPDDAICFVAGVSDVDDRSFLLASLVGRLPGYFLVTLAGARLADAQTIEAAILLIVLVVASALGYRNREAIVTRLSR